MKLTPREFPHYTKIAKIMAYTVLQYNFFIIYFLFILGGLSVYCVCFSYIVFDYMQVQLHNVLVILMHVYQCL